MIPGQTTRSTAYHSGPGVTADHFVYRCYDADGDLLYIGCTSNVSKRMAAHRRGSGAVASRWLSVFMARHQVEGPFRGRDAGREAERRAIQDEQPLFNYQGRVGESLAAWMTRRPIALYLIERGHIELAVETLCACDSDARKVGRIDDHCAPHVAAKVAGLTDKDLFDWDAHREAS